MGFAKRHSFDLVWVLAITDFKLRYHGSVLGYVWALLKPLFIFLILNFVFTHVFASTVEHYSLRLLTGIIMWSFFAEGTMTGLMSLMSKAHMLTKIPVSKMVLVVASTLNVVLTYVINLFVLALFYFFSGLHPSFTALLFFLGYSAVVYLLILAFSLLFAPLFIRFRDLNQIWEVVLTGGFYCAPIIYPLSIFSERVQSLLYLNPMTFLLQHANHALLGGSFSRLDHHVIYAVCLALFLMVSFLVFRRLSRKVVDFL